MKLTKHPFGHFLPNETLEPNRPINKYKVEGYGSEIFIIGFNLGRADQKEYWKITGRKGKFGTSDEALAALQSELQQS